MRSRLHLGRYRSAACGVLVALTAAGCGNRLSHGEIRAAAYGPVGQAAAPASPAEEVHTEVSAPGPATGDDLGPAGGTPGSPSSTGPSTAPQAATGGKATGDATPARTGRAAAAAPVGTKPATTAPSAPPAQTKGATPAVGIPAASGASCSGSEPPVTIATVGNLSGLVGAALINGVKAIQAWVQSVNDRGGISCHPVKYLTADDGSDPARNQALHREMVERRGVVAFVFEASPLGSPGSVSYLKEKNIPVIGEYGSADYMYEAPNFFPTASGGRELAAQTILAGSTVALPAGQKKLAILTCNEATWCDYAGDIFANYGTQLGFEVVSRGRTSLTQPDFTAQCVAAKNAGAQAFAIALAPEGEKRIASNCESVGFKPLKIVVHVQAALDFKDNPASNNTVIAMPVAPWFMKNIPGVREYQEQLKKYNPAVPYEPVSIVGWQVAKAFEFGTRTLPKGPVTSADILKGMWSLKNVNFDGLSPPVTYAEGKLPTRSVCGWAVLLKNGEFSSDGKVTCK